jgi:hypothetical protein
MRPLHVLTLAAMLAAATASASAQVVVGEMYASDASVRGSVLFAGGGTRIESGSSVTAGDAPAVLKLNRGGELRICPKTTVSVTASPSGRNLMMGMNTGAMEAHYTIESSADAIMTPDFRILLSGPGIFHFAVFADERGNACVRALAYNSASLIVTELNGDGSYQVKPDEQIMFHNGHVSNPDALVPAECGCPPPPPPVLTAKKETPPPPPPTPTPTPLTKPIPQETHVEMETPLVFQPSDPEQELPLAVSRIRLTSGPVFPDPVALPPKPAPKPQVAPPPQTTAKIQIAANPKPKTSFMHKVKGFFGAIFR